MALLSLLLSIALFIALFKLLEKKLGVANREAYLMLAGMSIFGLIKPVVILLMAIFTGGFLATLSIYAVSMLIDCAFSYYFMKQAGYDLLDLFRS